MTTADLNAATPPRTTYDRSYVESLFDSIAHRYDLLNRVLSAGTDVRWRRRAISRLVPSAPKRLLDVATGTADVALTAAAMLPSEIVGIDVSASMLAIAEKKIARRGLDHRIRVERMAAEEISFDEGSFDAVTVAFGVRNFANLEAGLAQFARVLVPGGVAVILEFSTPRGRLFGPIYRLYSRVLLPAVGGLVSRNKKAYEYLPRTVAEFPDGAAFAAHLRRAGFAHVAWESLTGGIASIYVATK